jgi:1-deoxy-D-xylulose-5-phosphate synthase
MRKKYYRFLKRIPYGKLLWELFNKVESRLKGLILPGQLFEELGIRYFGPVDGHNIEGLVSLFDRLKVLSAGPKMVHLITRKGKGYAPAEKDPSRFHGVGPFDRVTGKIAASKNISFSDVAGMTLARFAEKNHKIVAVTAAMKDGTGLAPFDKVAPKRLFDVGIAEPHAVTFASALARNGFKPFVAIYSTFLQRSYDQLIHDVGIMNLPVTFFVDRAGIVGEDGETHHGLFDLNYLRSIPNFMVLAPSTGADLRDMVAFAVRYNKGPLAIRFVRGAIPDQDCSLVGITRVNEFPVQLFGKGNHVALVCVGDMLRYAKELSDLLAAKGIKVRIVNIRTVKPLDIDAISRYIKNTRYLVTIENGYKSGGVGEEIVAELPRHLRERHILNISFPDKYITHGNREQLFAEYSISAEQCTKKICSIIGKDRG